MKKTFQTVITFLALSIVLVSCKDQNSIQTYFVDHQELPAFMSYDVSADVIDFSKANLNPDEQKAYQSVDKLDILAYRIKDNNLESYKTELQKAKKVFNNKKYEELMEFKDKGVNVKVSTLGNADTIDEFLVLASSNDFGFTIVRILGDNMKPEELIKLSDKLKNANVDQAQLKSLTNFFK
ncbi:MAG: DUF4252 domain-containing protein [Olleya sp.]